MSRAAVDQSFLLYSANKFHLRPLSGLLRRRRCWMCCGSSCKYDAAAVEEQRIHSSVIIARALMSRARGARGVPGLHQVGGRLRVKWESLPVNVSAALCQLPVWNKQTRAYLLQAGNRQNQTLRRLLKSPPNLSQSTHCSEIKTTKLITG